MVDNLSINNQPLKGATIKKIPHGTEIPTYKEAQSDGADNIFFKDAKGDNYMATGKRLNLKGVAPGDVIKFNGQVGTVVAVDDEADKPQKELQAARDAFMAHDYQGMKDSFERALNLTNSSSFALLIAKEAASLKKSRTAGEALKASSADNYAFTSMEKYGLAKALALATKATEALDVANAADTLFTFSHDWSQRALEKGLNLANDVNSAMLVWKTATNLGFVEIATRAQNKADKAK